MKVTITRLRQDLFKLVDRSLAGESLEFVHKGVVFRIVPETKPSKLSRLVGQKVVAHRANLADTKKKLLKEMEAEWEKDWAEL
jgi:antitoxin (DNA-binding transcriptional repressor) of toxin-antitoxin stability system